VYDVFKEIRLFIYGKFFKAALYSFHLNLLNLGCMLYFSCSIVVGIACNYLGEQLKLHNFCDFCFAKLKLFLLDIPEVLPHRTVITQI
jgi:hypothetical protein